MINLTLTITAAPELLAVMSNFTNSITSAKVVAIPKTDSDFTPQNTVTIQQPIQTQTPISVNPTYNQSNNGSVNTRNNQGASGTVNLVQAPQHVAIQAPQDQQHAPAHIQTNQAPIAQASTVPTTAQVYTMEQLAVAATQIVDAGRRTELVGLLSSFGVQALTALPKEQYGTFATQLRALGAKI